MTIKQERAYKRVTITGTATPQGILRAVWKLPQNAVIKEMFVVEDYLNDDRPNSFEMELEWPL